MNKEKAQQHIESNVQNGDSLIGFFQATALPKIWLFFLIGPFAMLGMKFYFLAVTQRGVSFHRMNLLEKFKDHDFFEFDEIDSLSMGKGLLQKPMRFKFKSGRKLRVKAQLKGVEKVAKLTPEVQQHLEKNTRPAK